MKKIVTNKINYMNVEQVAQVAHEVNKAYCEALGDSSQPSWEDAPDWQKTSAINGVKFHIANPDATPAASHESWLKQKTDEGWTYGPVKDPEKKEHPCFVPFDQLPVEQKAKDFLFRQVIHSLSPYTLMASNDEQRQLTFGEKAVGLSFNPSKMPEVDNIKRSCAAAIDVIYDLKKAEHVGEKIAQFQLAIRSIQEGQMWGVKAATWQE